MTCRKWYHLCFIISCHEDCDCPLPRQVVAGLRFFEQPLSDRYRLRAGNQQGAESPGQPGTVPPRGRGSCARRGHTHLRGALPADGNGSGCRRGPYRRVHLRQSGRCGRSLSTGEPGRRPSPDAGLCRGKDKAPSPEPPGTGLTQRLKNNGSGCSLGKENVSCQVETGQDHSVWAR
jgi:hypothetical protein